MAEQLPAANPHIQDALAKVGAKWSPRAAAWLRDTNPMAVRQLAAMEAKIDEAVADDVMRKACENWTNTWLFWIRSANVR
jgi:hypothetical protein